MSRMLVLRTAVGHTLFGHWAIATALLLILVPAIGVDDVWSADVGAQLAQSNRLANGGGWLFSHPLSSVDPSGEWYPFHLSGRVGNNFVVLAKHPLFTWLVAGLWRVGGLGAVMACGVVSTTTAAAGVGAAIKETISHRCAVVMFWIAGLLSPLAFDGFLGYAHTLAAAVTIWSFLFAIRAIGGSPNRYWYLPASALLIALGPMIRSEATLAGLAFGLALILTSGKWQLVRSRNMARFAGIVIGLTTLASFGFDLAITLNTQPVSPSASGSSWLDGRISGLAATWVWTSSEGVLRQDLPLLLVPLLWFIGAQFVTKNVRLSRYATLAGAALVLIWITADPGRIVPGLPFAFPLLVLLLGLAKREMFDEPIDALAAVSFLTFCGAVVLTQHPQGGTAEWGGRYFAVGIPFVLVALSGSVERLLSIRRGALLSIAVPVFLSSLVLVGSGLVGMRKSKLLVGQLEAAIIQAGEVHSNGAPNANKPDLVVVSTVNPVSRWAWQSADEEVWLLVPPSDLDVAMTRLEETGIERIVVVTETRYETSQSFGSYVGVSTMEPWKDSPLEVLTFDAS